MEEHESFEELIRIGDPVQADLLTAFLDDGDVEFQVVNRSGAGFMSQLMPRAANPVVVRMKSSDMDRGKALLDEYRQLQSGSLDSEIPADEMDQ